MAKKILFAIIFFFSITLLSYAKESDYLFANTMTIKELWQNIEKLKEEQEKLKKENDKLSKDYKELIWFIKDDLTNEEIKAISDAIRTYLDKRDSIETRLKIQIDSLIDTTSTKNELLIEKANFYKYIAKYVDINKKEKFIEHIKYNIQATKERKDLIEEILKNQNLMDKKVNYLKWKIEDHKIELNAQIEESVKNKVNERIDTIDQNEKYKLIDIETKNQIYINFINDIKQKLKELEKSPLNESYKQTRALIYNTMIENLEEKIKK